MKPEVEGSAETGARPGSQWRAFAATLCFLYGVAFTLNIHPIGDGLWFWYARLYREHHLLYSGMHLPLQPLFVLLTAWTQDLLGLGWLSSKVLAFVQLLLFCWGLFLVAGHVPWKEWQRALLLGGAFVMTLTADYFRFDDYHITGYCFEIFSIYLLLQLGQERSKAYRIGASLLLGMLCGLSLSNRLNDGAALFAGCAIALWFVAKGFRPLSTGIFCVGVSASFASVILLTGDRLRDWWSASIVLAATIKGGTGSVLIGPLHLLNWQIRYSLLTRPALIRAVLIAMVVIGVAQLSLWRRREHERGGRWKSWVAAVMVLAAASHSIRRGSPGWPNVTIGTYLGLLSIGVTAWAFIRVMRGGSGHAHGGWSSRETLVVVPFLHMAAGGATSGNAIYELLPASGVFLLLLPFCAPWFFKSAAQRTSLIALSCIVIASGLYFKTIHPYEWHHFVDRAMFTGRTWYRHPIYGEMYIDREQLQLTSNLCSTMNKEGPPTGMLEITNPYANWFCDVPPWHNYVQTWYDTVSSKSIEQLVEELKAEPPQWIVYQRSLQTMELHEEAFNHGKPLAHRDLDRLIVDRVAEGTWTIAYAQLHLGADWFLIRTAPSPGSNHP